MLGLKQGTNLVNLRNSERINERLLSKANVMEARHNDFKWFGEGFDGFPKHLPEDCVEYLLYIIDSKLGDSDIRSQLRHVQASANDLTKNLLKDYIWQRQSFKLELAHGNGLSFLRGQTSYGDSVEDEWLVVYMMLELSKQHPNAWIRITDTDGEFLLIEAANVLPPWLNPETGAFRPWVNEGKLFIIPDRTLQETQEANKFPSRGITFQEALRYIQENQSALLHSPLIEAEAFFRVRKFPKQITENLHHSLIRIPRKLAYILNQNASCISPAIEAFYLRDPISLRPLQTSDRSKLIFPPEDLVTVSVRFTKVGFAQLRSQEFPFPAPWQSQSSLHNDSKPSERVEVGMKVTCGFEMMLSDPHNMDNSSVREINLLLDDVTSGQDHLPSDTEISHWENKEDDDGWLDIDFQQFEDELTGRSSSDQARAAHGFGNRGAQENLRKIVARFEDFLNDDSAGLEGAEVDIMDRDDDDSDDGRTSDDTDSDGEDKGISFDEDQFSRMVREMMGMPSNKADYIDPQSSSEDDSDDLQTRRSNAQVVESDGEGSIREVMKAMAVELADAGVFETNQGSNLKENVPQTQSRSSELRAPEIPKMTPGQESDTDDVEIDYNLAKNLLESFKSQHGAAGPGGNLLGLIGVRLPRDEDDSQ